MNKKDMQKAPVGAVYLYSLAAEREWSKVVQRIAEKPEECKYVEPASKLTPLHLIVLGRDSKSSSGRLSAVRSILSTFPEAATMQNEKDGLTPLHFACMVESDAPEKLEEDYGVIQLMLDKSPNAVDILSNEGHSPLESFIITMSRLKKEIKTEGEKDSVGRDKEGNNFGSSTKILKALLEKARSDSTARWLDVLFECASSALLEQIALEEAEASSSKLCARRQARSKGIDTTTALPAPSTKFLTSWVWEWLVIILKAGDMKTGADSNQSEKPFMVVHSACQVKDCSIGLLMLIVRAYPNQVRIEDETTGDFPLHMVAGWETLDPTSISRKSMALSVLISEYPDATKIRNKSGKTPLSLALETGTSWDSGVRRLTTLSRR